MAAVVGQPAFLAVGVLQLEIAGRHAGQVHAIERRGVGPAAGQGQHGKRGQQQAPPRIGRGGALRASGRAREEGMHENLWG